MVSKRFLIVGLMGVFLVMFALALVVGQEDGDVGLDPFDATVSVQNAPPVIVQVYGLRDEGAAEPADNIIDPVDGTPPSDGVNSMKIRFLASDPNGEADLPGGAGSTESFIFASSIGDVPGVANANIEVYITSPGIEHATVNVLTASCSELPSCPDKGVACTANEREYECFVDMQYYFEPGVPGTDPYLIDIVIADPADDTGTITASTVCHTGTAPNCEFEYTQLTSFEITSPVGPPVGISWANVILSSTDQVADAALGITNRGNVLLNSGTIHSSDMTPEPEPGTGDSLPITAFSISEASAGSPPAQCCGPNNPAGGCPGAGSETADELSAAAPVTIGTAGGASPPNLPFGDGSGGAPPLDNELLNLCIWQQLDTLGLTISDQDFSSTVAKGTTPGTPGDAWELVLS
jgi:hypothetical protein